MADDYGQIGREFPDNHSVERQQQATIGGHTIDELWLDPASDSWSMSRLGLGVMNAAALVASGILLYQFKDPTALIVGVAGVDGAAYAASKLGRYYRGMPCEANQ